MLARIRKSMQEKDQGFTLIELLVVMIIIGILAAIAIPVFLNQRTKARETSAKADVSTIGKEIAAYYVDGTAELNLTTASGEWVLADAGGVITRGKLSGNNVAAEGTKPITGSDSFCAEVTSYATVGSTPDTTWGYDESGLVKGGC